MLNKNSMNIAKFSFINAIKSKGFISFNIILLIAIIFATNFNTVKEVFQKNDLFKGTIYNIKVIDENNYIYADMEKLAELDNVEKIEKISADQIGNEKDITKETIIIEVLEKEQGKHFKITSKEGINDKVYNSILEVAKQKRNLLIEERYGIKAEDIEEYNSDVSVERKVIEEDSVVKGNYYILTMVMTMIIYSLIIFGTNAIASQIANEKTSKSAEYVFTSTTSKDYLNGKVIGAGLKTLTNILLIILYLFIGLVINSALIKIFNINQIVSPDQSKMAMGLISGIDIGVIKYVVLSFTFILLTSILLSYIQAGMTAKVKSINEMDNSQSITLTIIIIAYMISIFTATMTNLFTKIISVVPVFSMFMMPTNYLNGVTKWYMILISLVLLIVAIIITMNIVGKNFKKHILDLGTRKEEKSDEDLEILEAELKKVKKSAAKDYITISSVVILLIVILQVVLGLIMTFVFPNSSAMTSTISTTVIFIVSFGIPIIVLNKLLGRGNNKKKERKKTDIKKSISYTLMGMPFIYLIGKVVELLIDKVEIDTSVINAVFVYDSSILGYILLFIEIAILPAILEELFFRKAMLDGGKRFGTKFAIIFTAIMFGLLHMNIVQSVNAFLIGLVLAFVVIKTGTILPAILIHFINNGTETLLVIAGNNQMFNNVIMIIYYAIIVIGALLIVINLLKGNKIYKLEKAEKADIAPKNIMSNYYLIVFVVLAVAMFVMLK